MLRPLFYTRTFGISSFQAPWLGVESARWAAVGGPEVARLGGVNDGRLDLARALGLLRCGVELVDESGQAAWWGYVSKIEMPGVVVDLERMNNRVRVSYNSLDVSAFLGGGIVNMTGWGDELNSQGTYGVKERTIQITGVSDGLAVLKRGLELGENGWPQAIPTLRTVGSMVGKADVFLTLRGWWNTASWRSYNWADGLIYDTEETAFQLMGDSVGTAAVYQSVSIPIANWRAESVWLNIARNAIPGDFIRVDICQDAGGTPGASLANAQMAAVGLGKAYSWQNFVFSTPAVLGVGVYWIKVSRTGALDGANCYRIGVDETLNYEGGVMWVAGGVRSPAADMIFMLVSGILTTDQIVRMAGIGAGGQFLKGVWVENSSGIYTNPFRAGKVTAQQEMINLLGAGDVNGNRLLAEVTQERWLRVYAQPGPSTAGLYVNKGGNLVNQAGMLAPAWTPAAGRWAVVAAAWGEGGSQYQQVKDRVLLGVVEYDPGSGGLRVG